MGRREDERGETWNKNGGGRSRCRGWGKGRDGFRGYKHEESIGEPYCYLSREEWHKGYQWYDPNLH